MKWLIVLIVLLAGYQNWDRISGWWADTPSAVASHEEVRIYTTQSCGYCKKAISLLKQQGVPYRELDIERSSDAHREFRNLGGRGVPVLDIRGQILHGYSRDRILQALR